MKKIKMIAALLVLPILLTSCSIFESGNGKQTDKNITVLTDPITTETPTTTDGKTATTAGITTELPITTAEPTEPVIEAVEATIIAVGDNLIHGPLITSGKKAGYDTLYKELAPMISAADLAIINQETIFTYNENEYSGYPKFASPIGIGEAALAAGFDVFSTATNHTADHGEQAILDTLDFWEKHPEGTVLGIYKDKADRDNIPVVTVNGIRIALLNYTYGMNQSLSKWWMVDIMGKTIKDDVKQTISARIEKAKEISDFVIVCAHWGSEYVNTPTSSEVAWAQFFADCGVDLVIGTHPHVVQPVMEVEGKNGNKTVVYYSLGNFVHNQNDFAPNIGGLATITLISDKDGVRIKDYNMVGTMVDCYYNENKVKCYTACLISEMTDERLKNHIKFSGKTVADFEKEFEKASTSYPTEQTAAA